MAKNLRKMLDPHQIPQSLHFQSKAQCERCTQAAHTLAAHMPMITHTLYGALVDFMYVIFLILVVFLFPLLCCLHLL